MKSLVGVGFPPPCPLPKTPGVGPHPLPVPLGERGLLLLEKDKEFPVIGAATALTGGVSQEADAFLVGPEWTRRLLGDVHALSHLTGLNVICLNWVRSDGRLVQLTLITPA